MSNVISTTGTLTAQAQASALFRAAPGKFNLSLWGTFVATVSLERSFDNGVTWLNCSKPDGSNNAFTAALSVVCEEPEEGVLYRVYCSAYTSGTVNYRISQ